MREETTRDTGGILYDKNGIQKFRATRELQFSAMREETTRDTEGASHHTIKKVCTMS